MTGSFPTRPDGLVDGTRIPWNAVEGGCAHEHASRVVPHLDGQDDVWKCPTCGERWRRHTAADVVAAAAARIRTLGQITPPLRLRFPVGAPRSLVEQAVRAELDAAREHQLRRHRYVVVPDTTTSGPSGLLARFRQRHTRKDRP